MRVLTERVRRGLLVSSLLTLAVAAPWASAGPFVRGAMAQAPEAGTAIGAGELQAFARAAREVFRVRQAYAPKVQSARSEMDARDFIVAAETEMKAVIARQGMTVDRYNDILKAAQRDASLAARIQALVDKEAAGK